MGYANKWYDTSEYCTATSSDDESWNPNKYSRKGFYRSCWNKIPILFYSCYREQCSNKTPFRTKLAGRLSYSDISLQTLYYQTVPITLISPGDIQRDGNIIYITPQVYFNKGAEKGKVDFFAGAPIDTENTIVYDAFSGYDAYKHQGIVNKKSEKVQLAQQKNPLPGTVFYRQGMF